MSFSALQKENTVGYKLDFIEIVLGSLCKWPDSFLDSKVKCQLIWYTVERALCGWVCTVYTTFNILSDNSSPHFKCTNGHPTGHSNGCLPSCNGNQWQLTMTEQSDPDATVYSNIFLWLGIQTQSPQCTICEHMWADHSMPPITSTCFQHDVVVWGTRVRFTGHPGQCLRFMYLRPHV